MSAPRPAAKGGPAQVSGFCSQRRKEEGRLAAQETALLRSTLRGALNSFQTPKKETRKTDRTGSFPRPWCGTWRPRGGGLAASAVAAVAPGSRVTEWPSGIFRLLAKRGSSPTSLGAQSGRDFAPLQSGRTGARRSASSPSPLRTSRPFRPHGHSSLARPGMARNSSRAAEQASGQTKPPV